MKQESKPELEAAVLGAILGEKKLAIIRHLIACCDELGLIRQNIADICKACDCSKPTAISTLNLLKQKGVLSRLKNGLYKLKI